ncbi:MAG TPA: formyltransferase family protein [Candidatus Paceibacterota bacterium]|nr:formyltransferase family protein [Candidatus Paceibacterota bacterium]
MQLKISILVDNPNSWIVPTAQRLVSAIAERGHTAQLFHTQEEIPAGDIAFVLGCEKILPVEVLRRNTHNIVVHPSALPQGRGFSPLTWQILDGKNDIPVTLFEAAEKVDTGPIYLQGMIHFEGHELNPELKAAQGDITIKLALQFLDEYPPKVSRLPEGEGSWYKRRSPGDSRLDPHKTLAEQFNLLRVADNERYPAFFELEGHQYVLRITKTEPEK